MFVNQAIKRLSIRKLPPVPSFQFKVSSFEANLRYVGLTFWQSFEHKTSDRTTAHKIEAPVRFPSRLNMAEFTTLAMKGQEKEKDHKPAGIPYPS